MKKREIIPNHHQMTEFLNDKVVLVNKNSKPQNIIISYDRYCRLKENGADI